MNAYIASFMLLLFNAVGLAVPASVAAEAGMISELGSAANLPETSIGEHSAAIGSARVVHSAYQSIAFAEGSASTALSINGTTGNKPAWAIVAMRYDIGDKLEHEEGAP